MTDFDEEFYEGFVDCFVGEKEDDEIYEELEEYLSYEFTETEKVEIRNLYLFIKYGYSATDKITGIPGEAFNDETFAKLMQEATKYIGFPYQWGGSTPETSFDCSGFVCWVYTIPEFITCPEQPHSRFITSVHRCQKTRSSQEIWYFLQEHIKAATP